MNRLLYQERLEYHMTANSQVPKKPTKERLEGLAWKMLANASYRVPRPLFRSISLKLQLV